MVVIRRFTGAEECARHPQLYPESPLQSKFKHTSVCKENGYNRSAGAGFAGGRRRPGTAGNVAGREAPVYEHLNQDGVPKRVRG